MPEEGDSAEVDGIVKSFPDAASQADAQVGSDDENRDNIQADGAKRIFERLLWRTDRNEDIHHAEAWRFDEQQNQRVDDGEAERDIAGPVVQAEVIETVMRPGAFWAVAED